jgi:hypothetical protein
MPGSELSSHRNIGKNSYWMERRKIPILKYNRAFCPS